MTVDLVGVALVVDALLRFLQPGTLVRVAIEGLGKAGVFLMVASGLSLIFGLMGVINFAHGSLTMIGAYGGGLLMVVLTAGLTGNLTLVAAFVAAAVIVFVALTVLGGAIEVALVRPLYGDVLYQILLTFGLTLILDEAARIVLLFYGMQPQSEWQDALATKPGILRQTHDVTAPVVLDLPALAPVALPVSLFDVGVAAAAALAAWGVLAWTDYGEELVREFEAGNSSAVALGAVTVAASAGVLAAKLFVAVAGIAPLHARGMSLFEIGAGAVTVAVIWLFLTGTRYGLVIRAGSEDAEMTAALGIDVRRAFTIVFGLGVGLAGVAGMLLMWDHRWGASVPLGLEILLPAFVVVIVGGLGSFRGTVVAALLVGFVDATMTWWFVNAIDFPGLPELTIFLILVGMLIVRPQGLFGVEEVGGH